MARPGLTKEQSIQIRVLHEDALQAATEAALADLKRRRADAALNDYVRNLEIEEGG